VITFIITAAVFTTIYIGTFLTLGCGLGGYMFYKCMKSNPLNDVCTKLNPPLEYTKPLYETLNDYQPRFARIQERIYPDIKTLVYEHVLEGTTLNDVYIDVLRYVRAKSRWEIIATDNTEKKIQVLSKSLILRFKNDIMIHVSEEGQGLERHFKVDMRSKSRLGMSDFGSNACCIRNFLDTLAASGAPTLTTGKFTKQF